MKTKDKICDLPRKPGVYLFKDKHGNVIYIGKSVSLRNRVRAYFYQSENSFKLKILYNQIDDLEHIVTGSELEALLLESALIKKYLPRFNRQGRRFKSYPYIRIDLQSSFPKVSRVYECKPDGEKYFGPFTNSSTVKKALAILHSIYPSPYCEKMIIADRRKVQTCLFYQIGRCMTPCTGAIDKKQYHAIIEEIVRFLNGQDKHPISVLTEKMEAAATQLNFEQAARLRDQIDILQKIIFEQQLLVSATSNNNLIAVYPSKFEGCFELFFILRGRMVGQERVDPTARSRVSLVDYLKLLIEKYFSNHKFDQTQIISQSDVGNIKIIASWLRRHEDNRHFVYLSKVGYNENDLDLVATTVLDNLVR